MPDDPRDRRTPPKGSPVQRAITERGGGRHLDLTRPELLKSKREFLAQHNLAFTDEEPTPVTLIALVRQELKDDIGTVSKEVEDVKDDVKDVRDDLKDVADKVDKVDKSLTGLTAEVSTSNKLMPQVLETIKDQLVATREELKQRRTIEDKIVLSKMEITQHEEITAIDERKETKRWWRKISLKLVTALTSTAVVSAVVTAIIAKGC
jgi:septal ring factor EnvC (AmiA/AmiB activator)